MCYIYGLQATSIIIAIHVDVHVTHLNYLGATSFTVVQIVDKVHVSCLLSSPCILSSFRISNFSEEFTNGVYMHEFIMQLYHYMI